MNIPEPELILYICLGFRKNLSCFKKFSRLVSQMS
jgi:hypothetical protein